MQKGEEPLRSFGDLMQFFDKGKEGKETEQKAQDTPSSKPATDAAAPDDNAKPPTADEGMTSVSPDPAPESDAAPVQTTSSDPGDEKSDADKKPAGSGDDDTTPQSPPNQSSPADAPTS